MQTQRETTALPQSVPERISLALLARLVELRKANVVTSSSYWEEWSQFKGKNGRNFRCSRLTGFHVIWCLLTVQPVRTSSKFQIRHIFRHFRKKLNFKDACLVQSIKHDFLKIEIFFKKICKIIIIIIDKMK